VLFKWRVRLPCREVKAVWQLLQMFDGELLEPAGPQARLT
jgi:hypothetical protein